jgi:hypothetical protein
MTNTCRGTKIGLLFLGILIFVATSLAQARPPIVEQIAKAYGIDSWGQIEAIRYTWHAEFPGVKVARAWTWEPKTGKVSYEGPGKDGKPVKVSYVRSELASQPDAVKNDVDPGFQNDNYWALFPFHAYWDTSASVEDAGMKKLPLGKGSAREVTVKYPSEVGGYTPGDTWTLFVGADNRVKEFHYHRGGDRKPTDVIATWADYRKAGPILFAMDHRGTADGKPLRIYLTDVAIKVTGSDTWVEAK